MKQTILSVIFISLASAIAPGADTTKPPVQRHPHMVSLSYYLTDIHEGKDADALVAALKKVKSVASAEVNVPIGFVQVGFDSHAVSYHQVAQAIADAGAEAGRKFDPRLKIRVPDYATGDNAAGVDKVLTGKRLLQRVRIEPLDKSKGEFMVHFLPLELEAGVTGPQGFNGGHLNHPIHDPVPRGLGLTYIVVTETAVVSK